MLRILLFAGAALAAMFLLREFALRLHGSAPRSDSPHSDSPNAAASHDKVEPLTPPLEPPTRGLAVHHLGHSLVGRDMPAMVAQLAAALGRADHTYTSQLGWGTTLAAHLGPPSGINGFDAENAHAHFRPARATLESGAVDAFVLTEMVELKDAIRYHDAPANFLRWTTLARTARPDVRIYLYETWHHLDHADGFLTRLDRDPDLLWRQLLARAWASNQPVHVIPAGRAIAALARALELQPLADLPSHVALFAKNADGTQDQIHLNDLGHYFVALVHTAVLYHVPTTGLPHALQRANGTPATAPSPAAAALMQRTVDELVRTLPETGVVLGSH